jgi:protein-disulfide isomerase
VWLLVLVVAVVFSSTAIAQSGNDVAAVVNGKAVTLAEVNAPIAAKIYALEQQIHTLQGTSLDAIVNNSLVEDEARRLHISSSELKKRYTTVDATVAESEVENEYATNLTAFGSMSADEAKERIRMNFQSQQRMRAYRGAIEALRARAVIEVRLQEPRMTAVDAGVDAAPSRGKVTAPVVITEFGDYECPYCKAANEALAEVLRLHPDDVRLEFRHFPLEGHVLALPAARAAVCAARQGHFWEFHDALFAAPSPDEKTVAAAVAASQLDQKTFARCVASDESRLTVMRDVTLAKRAGATGTPTFIVNGRVLRGVQDFPSLQATVVSELKQTSRNDARSSIGRKGGE